MVSSIPLKVKEKVPADASNYIDLPEYIHKVRSCEDLCSDIYEHLEGEHSNKELLKRKAFIKTRNI